MVESFSQYHQEDFEKILSSSLYVIFCSTRLQITVFLWLHFPELGKSCVLIRYCVTSNFYISRIRGVEHRHRRRISHNQSHLRFRFHAAFLKKENLHSLFFFMILYCLLGIRFCLQLLFASFSIVINVDKKLYLCRPGKEKKKKACYCNCQTLDARNSVESKKEVARMVEEEQERHSFSIAKQKVFY